MDYSNLSRHNLENRVKELEIENEKLKKAKFHNNSILIEPLEKSQIFKTDEITDSVEILERETKRIEELLKESQEKLLIKNKESVTINKELQKLHLDLLSAVKKADETNILNETLLKTIPFGMDIVNEKGDILFQSDSFKKNFKEETTGKKCWETYRDDKKQCSGCPLKSAIELGQTKIYESYGIFGGRIFEVFHTGMFYEGQKSMLEIFIDITERKKTESIIQKQNKELTDLNISKDRFISILAHDLKSPFFSLLGFSDLLLENVRSYDIEKIEKQISTIHQVAHNTYHLLEDILLWAKAQAGKLSFEPVMYNFFEIWLDIAENMRLVADYKNIELYYSVKKEISLVADKNMLKTVIRNLVSNAIKFTNAGGKVEISAKKEGTDTIISISDNGIGIEPENQAKLFDISHMNSTKGTAQEKGTGFGLILCKEFVEAHGGKIWVDSEPGKGSTFFFIIKSNLTI